MKPPSPRFGPLHSLFKLIEVEKSSDRFVLRTIFFVMLFSGLMLLISLNLKHSSPTPVSGGELKEGIVGTPRFVNPTLAINRTDQDVVTLIYSGVMRIGNDGALTPDVAESVTVSEDGLTYNILVKKDITFHDGTPLTARDIVFTYELIQNPDLKSPLKGNWTDVSVEQVNEYELNIVLKEPYAPFAENFLVGILPAHLWSSVPVEQLPFSKLNTEPVGSGPFALEETIRDTAGLVEEYTLTAYTKNRFTPNIDTMRLIFFTEEASLLESLNREDIDSTAYISSQNLAQVIDQGPYKVVSVPLPRIFGIFFNQNKSVALRDASARQALANAINRDDIINDALYGYGVPIDRPVVLFDTELESKEGSPTSTSSSPSPSEILDNGGWAKNNLGLLEKQVDGNAETLSFTLRTSNATLFTEVSEHIVEDWRAIGADVAVEQFEQTDLLQSVIRPREFQALLFGIDMNRSGDLYPFWHSSQKDDPGLNIAQYTNLTVDSLLTKARGEKDANNRNATLLEAANLIEQENPAIFLFRPKMNYVVRDTLVIGNIPAIAHSSDRFSNIDTWYTKSDTLWNIFRNNN